MSLFSEEEIEKSIKRRKKAVVPAWTELGAIVVLVGLVGFAAYSAVSGSDPATTPIAVAPVVSDPGVPFFSDVTTPETTTVTTVAPVDTVSSVPTAAVWASSGLEFSLDQPSAEFLGNMTAQYDADRSKPASVTAYTPFVNWSFSLTLADGSTVSVQATWGATSSGWVQV